LKCAEVFYTKYSYLTFNIKRIFQIRVRVQVQVRRHFHVMFWWLDSQDVDLDCLNSKKLLMSGLEVPNSTNVEQLEDGSTELNSLVGSWFSIDWLLTKGQETETYGVRYVSVWRQPRTQHYRSWYCSLAWCRMAVSWWSRASNQGFPIQNLENFWR
jgi:hypothetical protein